VGIDGSEGNTVDFNARLGLSGFYEDATSRWLIDMVYETASENNDTTENEFYAQLTRDWRLPEQKHFYFLAGRYDWDDFQEWEHRLSGSGGIGYEFIENDDWLLLGRAGAGGRYDFNGPDKGFTPDGLLGVDVSWNITDTQKLTFGNTYFPDLSHLSEFRNVTRLEWSIAIDAARNLALKLGAENEHESDPPGDDEKNDLTYYLTLVWDF